MAGILSACVIGQTSSRWQMRLSFGLHRGWKLGVQAFFQRSRALEGRYNWNAISGFQQDYSSKNPPSLSSSCTCGAALFDDLDPARPFLPSGFDLGFSGAGFLLSRGMLVANFPSRNASNVPSTVDCSTIFHIPGLSVTNFLASVSPPPASSWWGNRL